MKQRSFWEARSLARSVRHFQPRRLTLHLAFVAAVGSLPLACAPPATEARFDSPNPAARMYAIEKAARTNDVSVIHKVVEQLDSDDPAVRLLAIETLRRLTGDQYGYRHDDPPVLRRAAIKRWVAALSPSAEHLATTTSETPYE